MIRTAIQLKSLVRNLSGGDSVKAQIMIRNYVMERFLERMSLSKYRNHFILKGGVLVSAMVGLDNRSTMDIDATMKNMPLSLELVKDMLEEIIATPLDDGMNFSLLKMEEIMDEAEYGGICAMLEASLDKMRTPLKIDISTGDVITPKEVLYDFKLMFEDRNISILAYNLETVLAEKMETIITRGTANTRLRDFYDVYILQNREMQKIDKAKFKKAFFATVENRKTRDISVNGEHILQVIRQNGTMQNLWGNYQKKFDYAEGITWGAVMEAVTSLYSWTTE